MEVGKRANLDNVIVSAFHTLTGCMWVFFAFMFQDFFKKRAGEIV
jgi:hypothetical protein